MCAYFHKTIKIHSQWIVREGRIRKKQAFAFVLFVIEFEQSVLIFGILLNFTLKNLTKS